MEAPYLPESPLPKKPAIYSPQALIGFSAIFSALAGGILAHQSLGAAGQGRAARHALWMSVGYLSFCLLLGQVAPRIPGLGLGLGYAWGYWLSQYVKKYVPDEADYPRRSIAKPLLICLALAGALIAVLLGFKYSIQ